MRITQNIMADIVSKNLIRNTEQLTRTQELVSSGKRINDPSDDPAGVVQVIAFRKALCAVEQIERNIDYGESWLQQTDASLASVDNLLIRAKEIAEYQATETATTQTRQIAAKEVKELYDQLIQLANTEVGNSYIFAGHQTRTAPFSRDADYNAAYHGDDGRIEIIVGEETTIRINVTGEEAFDSTVNVFDVLRDLKDGLEADDTAAIAGQLGQIDGALEQVTAIRADVGARLNRLESTRNYYAAYRLNIEERLSSVEDADLAEAMTDLTLQETAYQASLAAAARIIQPSLIHFLG
jgi:flagellar hook-associated protein 3 FlgL